jgi:uncharacterized repeat protein (TIGR01451 family)
MKTTLNLLFVTAVLGVAMPAMAQGHLEIRTKVQKEETVMTADGKEEKRVVEANTVVPGDEVIYTVTFANVSDEAAENVMITNPLPAELTYIEGSADADGSNVEFSADGGTSFASPGELVVRDEAGERPARPAEFTHIRFVVADVLAPGASGQATFRARLN